MGDTAFSWYTQHAVRFAVAGGCHRNEAVVFAVRFVHHRQGYVQRKTSASSVLCGGTHTLIIRGQCTHFHEGRPPPRENRARYHLPCALQRCMPQPFSVCPLRGHGRISFQRICSRGAECRSLSATRCTSRSQASISHNAYRARPLSARSRSASHIRVPCRSVRCERQAPSRSVPPTAQTAALRSVSPPRSAPMQPVRAPSS